MAIHDFIPPSPASHICIPNLQDRVYIEARGDIQGTNSTARGGAEFGQPYSVGTVQRTMDGATVNLDIFRREHSQCPCQAEPEPSDNTILEFSIDLN